MSLSEDEYKSFYKQLTLDYRDPLLHLHIVSDAPVQFYSVVYIPEKADRGLFTARTDHGLKLYARKVLIQDYNKDFLPQYMRFIDGVVNSEDLPLNVARESIQTTRAIKRIGASIKGKVLAELERIAGEDPDRYQAFWKEFGVFIKEGIATEPGDSERLSKLLRFHSSVSDGQTPTVTLDEYVARMQRTRSTSITSWPMTSIGGAKPAPGHVPRAESRSAVPDGHGGQLHADEPVRVRRQAAAQRGRRLARTAGHGARRSNSPQSRARTTSRSRRCGTGSRPCSASA